jgi:urate oxidase
VIDSSKDTTDESLKQKLQHIKQNTEYLLNYVKALEFGLPLEEKYRTKFSYGILNFNYITAILDKDFAMEELKKLKYENFTEEQVKVLSYVKEERDNELPISTSTSQNIIYRLAKEFYGYTGQNDAMELMNYYSESTGHVHGLYYKDGRYLNNDWAKDQKFDLTYLDDKEFANEDEVTAQTQSIIHKILYTYRA